MADRLGRALSHTPPARGATHAAHRRVRAIRHALVPLVLASVLLARPASGQDTSEPDAGEWVLGTWEGYLQAAGLGVVYHIERAEDGTLNGTMDVPQQGTTGIPLNEVSLSGDTLRMAFPVPGGGSFEGVRSAGGADLSGTFRQGAATLELVLQKSPDAGGG